MNKDISNVYSWVKANKFSLTIDKTNFMLSIPKCFPIAMGDIIIDGYHISEVKGSKCLGVIMGLIPDT